MTATRTRSVVTALIIGVFVSLVAGDALAQQYPPATPTPTPEPTDRPSDACLVVRGESDGEFTVGDADFRARLEVEGSAGCADPRGDVSVTVRSNPVLLGTFQAFEDGSFREVFCLPPTVRPGDHTVEVSIEGRGTLERGLRVEAGNQNFCAVAAAAGTGTLPRTGADLLLLVLFALALVGLGTILVATAWRYRERWALALTRSRRARRGSHHVLALPPAEIPFVDTSRFIPGRARFTAPRDETLTEWDDTHRTERPPD